MPQESIAAAVAQQLNVKQRDPNAIVDAAFNAPQIDGSQTVVARRMGHVRIDRVEDRGAELSRPARERGKLMPLARRTRYRQDHRAARTRA